MRVRLRVGRPSWAVVLASAVLLASALLPGGATGSNAELESEAAALRFRQQYGFAADASTVRLAQNDPGASTEFGVPLLSSMSSTGRGVYSHITYALSAMGASLCTTCP